MAEQVHEIVTGAIEGQASMVCTPSECGWSADMLGEGLAQKWPNVPCAAEQGHGHHNREALPISLWFFSATGLSFAIGNGLLTLEGVDALRALDLAVELIGIHGLVVFQHSP